eukprot:TRINITY_DN59227_c0_g1_i1.p1 TRINITY_DN59227_c0_g1~~TRINITY_DN59227_c0_g1_i1.p1  ORF type:complete len:640 (+),score=32.76 TRINITY_DN59227_c0_g1_i1:69-1988(+)
MEARRRASTESRSDAAMLGPQEKCWSSAGALCSLLAMFLAGLGCSLWLGRQYGYAVFLTMHQVLSAQSSKPHQVFSAQSSKLEAKLSSPEPKPSFPKPSFHRDDAAAAGAAAATAQLSRPRHILLFLIDDLGFNDMGFQTGGQIKTPTFDYFAKNGVLLANHYVQSSCSPSRGALLTGRYPVHTGLSFFLTEMPAKGLPLREVLLPQFLSCSNFTSHAVGKWHLGHYREAHTPTFRGFDSFYGFYNGEINYLYHMTYVGALDVHDERGQNCGAKCSKDISKETAGNYTTHLYTQRAVDIISEHDPRSPLFLFLSHQAVHWPRQVPQKYEDPYVATIPDKIRRTFAGMLSALDESLATVRDALTSRGMFNDTLILVLSDNGGPTQESRSFTGSSNWPLRGAKGTIFEGGTRGVAFLYWSGLPAKAKGLTWNGLSHIVDWLPTLASAVGTKLQPTLPLDGIDLWEAILTNSSSPRKDVYYGISQGNTGPAVRDAAGQKLIIKGAGSAGMWSQQQLPGQANSTCQRSHELLGGALVYPRGQDVLYSLVGDPREQFGRPAEEDPEVHRSLMAIVRRYEATKRGWLHSDRRCGRWTCKQRNSTACISFPWCESRAPSRRSASKAICASTTASTTMSLTSSTSST